MGSRQEDRDVAPEAPSAAELLVGFLTMVAMTGLVIVALWLSFT